MHGFIDRVDGLYIYGWAGTKIPGIVSNQVLFKLDGKLLHTSISWYKRKDVNEHLGVEGDFGFTAEVLDNRVNGSKLELFYVNELGEKLVYSTDGTFHFNNPQGISKLEQLRSIASQPNSVAICIWDCTHNPIGRAKVLYDVVEDHRPKCIIAFDFGFSKSKLWEPISDSDINVISIPWASRNEFAMFIKNNEIYFDTVWACKPRMPTIWLASAISTQTTKLIIDIDDNEEHLSNSKGSLHKPYGTASNAKVKRIISESPAFTCASISLNDKYNGLLLRHARKDLTASSPAPFTNEKIRLGFVGTVRPHKGILDVAKVIHETSSLQNIELVVGGIFNPKSIEDTLGEVGAKIIGFVPQSKLYETIGTFDILITGYPTDDEANKEITDYQISSKIGDALCCGRPVMVPFSPSVADLQSISGVYLFDEYNFVDVLNEIIADKSSIDFDSEFSMQHSYEQFLKAEAISKSKSAGQIHGFLELSQTMQPLVKTSPFKPHKEKIVLLWKQYDAGLYGRRIDVIARDLKKTHPNKEVIVLELVHRVHNDEMHKTNTNPLSSQNLLAAQINQKLDGIYLNDVYYKSILSRSFKDFRPNLEQFLLANNILPSNSNLVVFPLIQNWVEVLPTLLAYPLTVDMVDNQLSWATSTKVATSNKVQYLSFLSAAKNVIFNSLENKNEFLNSSQNFISNLEEKASLIGNWYSLPKNFPVNKRRETCNSIVYSGNLNDRIDWQLFHMVALEAASQGASLEIIGDGQRVEDEIKALIQQPNVTYHGPLIETECLKILLNAKFAVMPHKIDNTSKFMNPLKVQMYQTIGLPCVSTNVPGIIASELLCITNNRMSFIKEVSNKLNSDNSITINNNGSDTKPANLYYEKVIQMK